MVVLGSFPRPKKFNSWHKRWFFDTFLKSEIFVKRSILIICHFGHFSIFELCSVYVSCNKCPSDFTFWCAFFWFLLKKQNIASFFLRKDGQHSGCWQRPREHLEFFIFYQDFGCFPRQKENFQGPKNTYQFLESVHPKVPTKDFFFLSWIFFLI